MCLETPAFGQTAAPEQVKKGRLRSFLLAPRLRELNDYGGFEPACLMVIGKPDTFWKHPKFKGYENQIHHRHIVSEIPKKD